MTRVCLIAAVSATIAAGGYLTVDAIAEPPVTGQPATVYKTVTETTTTASLYHGHSAGYLAMRLRQTRVHLRASVLQQRSLARKSKKQTLALKRRWAPTAREVVALAAIAYGQSYSTLYRKGECESHWDPGALNKSGAGGWFQFLASTWAGTPYAAFSRFDPLAASLAAAWMHEQGRGGEWVCR